MQPTSNTFLPLSIALSIAEVDSSVYREPRTIQPAPAGARPAAGPDAWQKDMLAAVSARSAEVESAEWALDQSLSLRNEQIVAALGAGVPPEEIAAAVGLTASELEQIANIQPGPQPATGSPADAA